MKISICQLSDIHFNGTQNKIIDLVDEIANAIISRSTNCESCFLVFSGDISFSGKSDEYSIAIDFIAELSKKLEKPEGQFEKVHYLFVPGNHDCDFGIETNAIRDIAINSINEKAIINESIINQFTLPQSNFFEMCSLFDDSCWGNRLHSLKLVSVSNKKVLFLMLNSAWLSKINEQLSTIYFPEYLIPEIDISRYDVVIAILHHPFNWFQPMNSQKIKKRLESIVDIIITGHEHCSERITKESSDNTSNGYYNGGILQDHNGNIVGVFNTIIIDLDNYKEHFCQFSWNGRIFKPQQSFDTWNEFARNKVTDKMLYRISKKHLKYIEDIGVKFNHPYKENLALDDIYLYPEIEIFRVQDKGDELVKRIKSDKTFEFIKN